MTWPDMMSLVAAFLWSKSTSSIATVIVDDDTMHPLLKSLISRRIHLSLKE
jgi:hypothetical protein